VLRLCDRTITVVLASKSTDLGKDEGEMSLEENLREAGAPATWEEYATLAADATGKLARGKISLSACYDLLPSKTSLVSKEVHQFIENIVSEVDNDQSGFRELQQLLETGATQSQVVDFMRWPGRSRRGRIWSYRQGSQ
jgi:hypothetical protein